MSYSPKANPSKSNPEKPTQSIPPSDEQLPPIPEPYTIQYLQRTIGNQATQRLLMGQKPASGLENSVQREGWDSTKTGAAGVGGAAVGYGLASLLTASTMPLLAAAFGVGGLAAASMYMYNNGYSAYEMLFLLRHGMRSAAKWMLDQANRSEADDTVQRAEASLRLFDRLGPRIRADDVVGANAVFRSVNDICHDDVMEYVRSVYPVNTPTYTKYFFALPMTSWTMNHSYGHVSQADYLWINQRATADYMIGVLLGMRDVQDAMLTELFMNPALITAIEAHATPVEFTRIKTQIRQLGAVYATKDHLAQAGHGDETNPLAVTRELFQALLGGANGLSGFSYRTGANQVVSGEVGSIPKWLTGVKPYTQGPCSVLVNVFIKLLKTYPAVKIPVEVKEIQDPVMTIPLNNMNPANQGYVGQHLATGNVYSNHGGATRQVFFSGGSSGAAHTYVRVMGVDFDLLFGTTGGNVVGAIDDEYTMTDEATGSYRGKVSGNRLRRDPSLRSPQATTLGFNAYKFE